MVEQYHLDRVDAQKQLQLSELGKFRQGKKSLLNSNERATMALDRSPELRLAMKMMPIKGFSCFSSGGHFVQWSKTVIAILVEGHLRNISMKLF